MSYFCKDAQEEALKEIAKQMQITNDFNLLRELHNLKAISDKEYAEKIKWLYKNC